MNPSTAIRSFEAVLPHGVTLSCRTSGPDAGAGTGSLPTVLLLHGFPESAWVWDDTMLALAGQARCIAPCLRGYAPSSAPVELEAYRARHLVEDLDALVDRLGTPVDLLVAHDWGGALAWNLAAARPARVRRLLIINAPHPGTFLRELRDNPAQQKASAYMNFLCRPDAQALLTERDFARLWPFFERMGGAAWLTPALRERYRQTWRAGLEGPLNYYRASPLRPPRDAGDTSLHALTLPPAMLRVTVPTTVLWGLQDTALRPGLLEGLQDWVPELDLVTVPEASHWIVHEQPATVRHTIQRLIGS